MLLERSQWLVGLVVTVILLAGTLLAIGFDRSWVVGGYNVTAEFSDAAGLESGANVLIAGVRSGRVESVRIVDGHAEATLRIEKAMPSDTRAHIVLQNFLGKRAVRLLAGSEWDDELSDGDVIPMQRTSTPVDFAEFNEASATAVGETDVEALTTLVTSLADVTEGQREEVGRLLDGLERLSGVIADRRDQLRTAIVRSNEVFGVLADKDTELRRIIDAFGSTLERLDARRADIVRLLEATADAGNLTADLVGDQREQLDRVLDELHRDLVILDAHQVDVSHIFAYMGVSFEGYASIFKQGEGDNPYWGNIFAQSQGSIGVDAIVGCGGAVDQLLDEAFGEDPRSCEEQDVDDSGGAAGADAPSSSLSSSLRGFFTLGGAH